MAVYNPQIAGIPSNKAPGLLNKPIDSRSWCLTDDFSIRPFVSTAEVLAYFDTPDKRAGNFEIYININNDLKIYWFKNGVSDANLVEKITGGGTEIVYIPSQF